jgi:hypothetical protein
MPIQPRGPTPTTNQDILSPAFLAALNSTTGATVGTPTGSAYTVSRYTQPQPLQTSQPVPPSANAPIPLNLPAAMTANSSVQPTAPAVAKPTLATVDENAIREETRKRMQASIDAINAQFTNLISQEQVAGQDRSGQTRAVNARSGLVGSDFGAAQTEKTNQFNKGQVQAIEAEKGARLNAVLLNIEDRASAEIANKKQEALGQYERDFASYKETQEQARGDLMQLAKSGVALESLNPAQKAALLKQAGYDDPAFGELVYNSMKPKAQQIDYKFEKLADGQGLFYGVDPTTGELITKNVKVDLPQDWQMQIAPDGTVIGYDKNTGEARILSGKGEFADPYDQAYKEAQIQKLLSDIAQGQGDGLLSIEEANKLGVPYGTTKSQAIGIVPGSQEKIAQAETQLNNTNTILGLIQTLKNHPGLDGATGLFGAHINIFGNSRDFVAKFDQLKANLSLENISKLKGTGAISDAEQQLLANAASALRRDGDKNKLIEELDRLAATLGQTQNKLQNIINVGNQSTIQEFETQYNGGSEGTNPKAPSTIKPQSSSRSVNTKALASAVLPKYPSGATGGQCVTFLHKIASFPSIGDGKKQKFASVDKYGIPASKLKQNPKVGMIIITGENKTYGHGAMINAISADGKYARLTESNYRGNEKVTHDRVIALDSPQIYGAIIPKSYKGLA